MVLSLLLGFVCNSLQLLGDRRPERVRVDVEIIPEGVGDLRLVIERKGEGLLSISSAVFLGFRLSDRALADFLADPLGDLCRDYGGPSSGCVRNPNNSLIERAKDAMGESGYSPLISVRCLAIERCLR